MAEKQYLLLEIECLDSEHRVLLPLTDLLFVFWKAQGCVEARGWKVPLHILIYLCLGHLVTVHRALLKFLFKNVTFKIIHILKQETT